jgi:hypothetical protein
VRRCEGLEAPIQVEAADLPPGLTAEPVVIGPGQHAVPLVLTAAPDALATVAPFRLIGRALAGGRKDLLAHKAGQRQPLELEHASQPREQYAATRGQGIRPVRSARALPMAVLAAKAPFLLTARPARLYARPGETVELTLDLARGEGFTEAVALTTPEMPPNVGALTGTIAKDQTSASLKIALPANAPPGIYTIVPRGAGPFPFNKDPAAKDKPAVTVTEPANPVTLTIFPPG